MSIYPVTLSEWFKPTEDEYDNYRTVLILVKVMRCEACRKKPRYKTAVGHHSLPWGYGEMWCSWECCNSGKTAKPDKRRERRYRRRYGKLEEKFILLEKK